MKDKLARIHALLRYADEQQKEVSDEYSKYLDGDIPPCLQIRVKNYFENARSLLDYIASDICVGVLGLDKGHKCYFPTRSRSEEELGRYCQKHFPGIEVVAPDIYEALVSVQPFHGNGLAALVKLSEYTNENKHRDLTVQRMIEEPHQPFRFLVVRHGETATKSDGCEGYLVADETRQDPFLGGDYVLGNIGKIIEVNPKAFRYLSFKFAETGDDVIVTLMTIQWAVEGVVDRFTEPLYGRSNKNAKRS